MHQLLHANGRDSKVDEFDGDEGGDEALLADPLRGKAVASQDPRDRIVVDSTFLAPLRGLRVRSVDSGRPEAASTDEDERDDYEPA